GGVFHISASSTDLKHREAAKMVTALEERAAELRRIKDQSYKSLYRSSWDLSVLDPEQVRDMQMAFRPERMHALEQKMSKHVFIRYENSLYDLDSCSEAVAGDTMMDDMEVGVVPGRPARGV
ncbi:unnamed protein product, partial [Amoebophrya sp. A25]